MRSPGSRVAEREAEHNLLLGLLGRLRRDQRSYGSDPYLALVEDGGRIVAAALRTPPHNVVLSGCFLFIDLSNPTSNSIYQRVGYRPVTDVNQWAFQ